MATNANNPEYESKKESERKLKSINKSLEIHIKSLEDRLKSLEGEKAGLLREAENQRIDYGRCFSEVTSQILQALVTQKVSVAGLRKGEKEGNMRRVFGGNGF